MFTSNMCVGLGLCACLCIYVCVYVCVCVCVCKYVSAYIPTTCVAGVYYSLIGLIPFCYKIKCSYLVWY